MSTSVGPNPTGPANMLTCAHGEEEKNSIPNKPASPGLNRIPIAVSTSSVWYIEVSETPKEGEIEKFLEMQRLMFGTKQNK